MTVFEGSRYAGKPVVSVTDADGNTRKAIYADLEPFQGSFTTYMVVEGDRMDLIAERMYGNPNQWHLIALANPEVFYPDLIEPGVVLRIPV